MKKRIPVLALIAVVLVFLPACEKREEKPVPRVLQQGPIPDSPATTQGHEAFGQKMEFKVIVPPDVQESWSGVMIVVKDKNLSSQEEYTVTIGDTLQIPDSGLTVEVGHFLPHFQMSGQVITSASNDPENPSAAIKVFEGDTQLFPERGEWGWLYSKFPAVHPFQHERFELALKEGIKK